MKLTLRVLLLSFVTFLLLGQIGTGSRPSSLQYSFVPGCAPNQLWCLTALAVGRVETQAVKLVKEESTLRMTGEVKISTSVMVVTADEAEYHLDSNDIEARGNVHVHLK
jgi:lipopolysaccharide assembly outer membrane protein LptD (OstA)